MKNSILLIVLIPSLTQAQEITGKLNGILTVPEWNSGCYFFSPEIQLCIEMDSHTRQVLHFQNSTLNFEITWSEQAIEPLALEKNF